MRLPAKIYLGAAIGCGTLFLALSLWQLRPADPVEFAVLLTLALLGSGMKVRLPGVGVSMSISFLPILMSTALLSAAEAVLIGAAAAIAQTALRAKTRSRPVQVAFNVSSLVLSVGLASAVTHAIAAQGIPGLDGVSAAVAATVYYLTNAVLVSGVVSVTQSKPFSSVWDRTYWLSLPYYVAGAALVLVGLGAAVHGDWRPSLLVLPVMLLAYKYYVQWVASSSKTA